MLCTELLSLSPYRDLFLSFPFLPLVTLSSHQTTLLCLSLSNLASFLTNSCHNTLGLPLYRFKHGLNQREPRPVEIPTETSGNLDKKRRKRGVGLREPGIGLTSQKTKLAPCSRIKKPSLGKRVERSKSRSKPRNQRTGKPTAGPRLTNKMD